MINIAIIGYGYWGPNLVRNFLKTDGVKVSVVGDLSQNRLDVLCHDYPQIPVTKNINTIFDNEKIDAVVIATPVKTHFSLVEKALKKKKHVLVEKPITTSLSETKKLILLAGKYKKTLMVDHTFIYSLSVQKIKSYLNKKELGRIKYIDSTRINLGLFQSDVNVLWDLAPHDLSVIFYLLKNEKLISVQAIGMSHLKNKIEDVAYLILKFKSGLIAHLNCSWYSPVKVRTMLFGGDKKMIVWNDLEPTEKVKIYDKGIFIKNQPNVKNLLQIGYRQGDIYIPYIELGEALHFMAKDFVDSINTGKSPESNSQIALKVVNVLELADFSIKNKGKEMKF
jgi:predicted dehydrogenase